MKKILPVSIFIILLVVALTPFCFGYFFEKIYYQHVAYAESQIKPGQGIQVKVDSYHRGWFQSTASVTVTHTYQSAYRRSRAPAFSYRIDSVIYHGPFIFSDGRWMVAYAYLETVVRLPDLMKMLIPENPRGFMQVNTQLAFNGTTWKSHYSIPAITLEDMVQWDGVSGDVVIETLNHRPVSIHNKTIIGKVSASSDYPLAAMTQEPIEYLVDMNIDANDVWNGVSSVKSAGVSSSWKDNKFAVNDVVLTSKYGANGNKYHYSTDLGVAQVQLPPSYVATKLTDIKYKIAVKDLNVSGLDHLKESMYSARYGHGDVDKREKIIGEVLLPTSALSVEFGMQTNLGAALANLKLSLLSVPKTEKEVIDNINADLDARISRQLVEASLVSYVKHIIDMRNRQRYYFSGYRSEKENNKIEKPLPDDTKIVERVKTMLTDFVQKAYVVEDKNDYILSLNKNGQAYKLNGKPVDDMKGLLDSVSESIQMLAGSSCYWMSTSPGNPWVSIGISDINECFKADSCSRGMGQSGGGCYKWAESASAKREPWNADSEQNMQPDTAATTDTNTAYVVNAGNNTVSVCTVKADGMLVGCVAFSSDSFHAPKEIAFNVDGAAVTVINSDNQPPSICRIGVNHSLYACSAGTSTMKAMGDAKQATLTIDGKTFMYTVNSEKNTVTACQQGSAPMTACVTSEGDGTFSAPSYILLQKVDSAPLAVKVNGAVNVSGSWNHGDVLLKQTDQGISGTWIKNGRVPFSGKITTAPGKSAHETLIMTFPDDNTFTAVITENGCRLSWNNNSSWVKDDCKR